MNDLSNRKKGEERRMLPYVVEFVKFATGFAAIVAAALFTLHIASASIG